MFLRRSTKVDGPMKLEEEVSVVSREKKKFSHFSFCPALFMYFFYSESTAAGAENSNFHDSLN